VHPRARQLADHQRAAVAAYFSVYRGQEKDVAKVALGASLHPAAQRAYATLKDFWLEVGSLCSVVHLRTIVLWARLCCSTHVQRCGSAGLRGCGAGRRQRLAVRKERHCRCAP
jgi:hypothetical protein